MSSRLRMKTSVEEDEKLFRKQIKIATIALLQADGLCQNMIRRKRTGQVVSNRVHTALRTLRSVLRSIESIGKLTPGIDMSDPDLMPETQKKSGE